MPEKLKPCPFCGGKAKYSPPLPEAGDYVDEVGCENIGCRVLPKAVCLSKKDAVSCWNTRPIEDALRSRIKELEANSKPYTYIGKDGKPVLARDLEDERDALKEQVKELEVTLGMIEQMTTDHMARNAARQALNPGKEGKSK